MRLPVCVGEGGFSPSQCAVPCRVHVRPSVVRRHARPLGESARLKEGLWNDGIGAVYGGHCSRSIGDYRRRREWDDPPPVDSIDVIDSADRLIQQQVDSGSRDVVRIIYSRRRRGEEAAASVSEHSGRQAVRCGVEWRWDVCTRHPDIARLDGFTRTIGVHKRWLVRRRCTNRRFD